MLSFSSGMVLPPSEKEKSGSSMKNGLDFDLDPAIRWWLNTPTVKEEADNPIVVGSGAVAAAGRGGASAFGGGVDRARVLVENGVIRAEITEGVSSDSFDSRERIRKLTDRRRC
ncbi:hypothetical protein L1987_32480 [Smallanthus sonchifolius]|uniref:Uncharacterized protein n=1 Tax=Smallanthus sonchifolius TaxID=185202 RepID=A0ACB9HQ30_9ASTR|nr:hypothetical protein L1987_32480 [Smallanthus sonchifolius]